MKGPLREATVSFAPDCGDDDGTSTLFHVEYGNWRIRSRSDTHLRQDESLRSTSERPEYAAYMTSEENRTSIHRAQAWILIAAYFFERPHRLRNMWVTCYVLDWSRRDPDALERLGHNNQPWHLLECDLSQEEPAELNHYVYGSAEKTVVKTS